MPYDALSVGVILSSAALFGLAARGNFPFPVRVGCILLAASIIRADAITQFSLHPWDERFHALVARNLIAHPLVPALYREALLPYDYRDWMANHVWLHKPPGALWPMAASMAAFGVNEIALRLPSAIFSTLSVWLTYVIGARLFEQRVGLLAAGFHTVNGFLVALAAGRRVADHVDTALVFWIEVGVWCAFEYEQRRRSGWLIAAGIALGAALLTKSLPALLIVAVAFVVFVERDSALHALKRCAALAAIGVTVWAPWMIYTRMAFPLEAAWTWQYTLLHLIRPLESHDAGALSYLLDMPEFFGELVWIPIVAGVAAASRHRRARVPAVWVVVTYVVFSAAPTRISAFVMIAAPAIFLLSAHYWYALRDRTFTGVRRVAVAIILVALLLLPARYLLEPASVFERRDRSPQAFNELRHLDAALKLDRGVIFNAEDPIETMFYSRLIAYRALPTGDQVRELTAKGIPIVIFVDGRTYIPPEWGVISLRRDQLR